MRFYWDRPDVENNVQWFFTDEDAPPLGIPTVFNSRGIYFGSADAWPKLGEVEGARRLFANGLPPALPVETGLCGTRDAFLNGVSFDQADTAPHTVQGQLLCCVQGDVDTAVLWLSTFVPPLPPPSPPGALIVAGSVNKLALREFIVAICDRLNAVGVQLGLFVNKPVLTPETTLADLEEPTYPGYVRVPADLFIPFVSPGPGWQIASLTNIFSSFSPAPEGPPIQGIFGVTTGGLYLWATYFGNGPQIPPTSLAPSNYSFKANNLNALPMVQPP